MENEVTDIKSKESSKENVQNKINWGQYGLSDTPFYQGSSPLLVKSEYLYTTEKKEEVRDLFEDEQEAQDDDLQQPWWKTSFFITSKLLFGTWDGVFTTCVMNMVGVVIFLRSGWMVGFAGIGLSLLIVLLSFVIAVATVMSAVGICDRCDIGRGGVYFIITHVLGGKIGGAIGLLYCLGHATATALYCTGFAESLVGLVNWSTPWAIRCVSIITLFVLLGIALSGVKWIIRFQLLLIFILGVAVFDYVIGTLAQVKPEDGFTGFSNANFNENLKSDFSEDVTFFVVFGVFFPTACGVLAGVNMSGDLKDPQESIPEGSLAAIGVCDFLYTVIILFLGSTCVRDVLQTDYMIMEKVSVVGGLLIFGLFVASLSSSLGGLMGPPRVLQCIAEHDVLPVLKPFSKLSGINQEPNNATLFIALIALLFIFIGNLNAIAPIVTMPFLMTYTTINYAYFAMAMSYDMQKCKTEIKKDEKKDSGMNNEPEVLPNGYEQLDGQIMEEIVKDKNKDNTNINSYRDTYSASKTHSIGEATELKDMNSILEPEKELFNNDDSFQTMSEMPERKTSADCKTVIPDGVFHRNDSSYQHIEWIQKKHPNELYAKVCNRWVSLFTAFLCLLLSFCINWIYALANLSLTLLLYIFISQARPGLSPGVSNDFSFGQWLYNVLSRNGKSGRQSPEHIVVQNGIPYGISMYQVSQENSDYEHRDRKHHASLTQQSTPY